MKYAYCTGRRIKWTTYTRVNPSAIREGIVETVVGEEVTPDTHYVQDGVCYELPASPGQHYVFDFETLAWIDPRALDTLRATAHAAIERWRDTQESAGLLFDHAGREWDGGLIVRQRLQPVLTLPALPPGFFWTDAANEDVPVDMLALQSLAAAHEQALVIRGFEIHARQRAMKNALETMTREQLLAFTPDWETAL